MKAIMELLSSQHGVMACAEARRLGLSWAAEQRMVDRGVLDRPAPGVLRSLGAPFTWHQRARIATLAPGNAVLSHGSSARLHHLDGFDRYERIEVICPKGWWPNAPDGTVPHATRGPRDDEVTTVEGIRTLNLPATLTLLTATAGLGATARALDSALRRGATLDELRTVARRWQRRGRQGPGALLMLLDERDGKVLPRSYFQRLAGAMLARHGIKMVDEYEVRTPSGVLLAELDLACPELRIGIECQSWRWHATPEAQHRDSRRRGTVRTMGWEIVDVWWRDLKQPDRVLAEFDHLVRTRRAQLNPELSA